MPSCVHHARNAYIYGYLGTFGSYPEPVGSIMTSLLLDVMCHSNESSFLQPDYDDIEEENRLKPFPSSRGRDKAKDSKKYGEYLIINSVLLIQI